MLSLTRSFAHRVSFATFKTAPRLAIQRPALNNALTSYRSFSITPSVFAVAAKAKKSTVTKTAGRTKSRPKVKTAIKKKPKTKIKAKPKARTAARKASKPKKKVAAAKPPSTRVPLIARPPKKPASAYFIFFNRTSASPKTTIEANEATKDAAAIWNRMTDAEKKPFFDEYKNLYTDYEARRTMWYKDPKNAPVLRKLNKHRKKYGKTRIHIPEGIVPKKPITGFLRFYNDLRSSGRLSQADAPAGTKRWVVWAAREAGSRWNVLPPAEKAKYNQQFHDAK